MLSSPFPDLVSFAYVDRNNKSAAALLPSEAGLLSEKAVESRRRSFRLGRVAARIALGNLGAPENSAVLQSREGAPIWPAGFIGSISHSEEVAVAAVAQRAQFDGIGVDIELIDREVDPDVVQIVADEDERLWIDGTRERLIRLFSAKEAIFKAFYPQIGSFFGFDAAKLKWLGNGAFRADVDIRVGRVWVSQTCVVHSHLTGDHVLSALWLPSTGS